MLVIIVRWMVISLLLEMVVIVCHQWVPPVPIPVVPVHMGMGVHPVHCNWNVSLTHRAAHAAHFVKVQRGGRRVRGHM